jgi:hypothetical protein
MQELIIIITTSRLCPHLTDYQKNQYVLRGWIANTAHGMVLLMVDKVATITTGISQPCVAIS